MNRMRTWFRPLSRHRFGAAGTRPSDDEMREELESHVAMRAEHDRVDAAAARRRLGNTLRTREAMRRVWVAEWWDALRQDARFTWRSWVRQPGFALGAILVLALGLGASTALFAALDRALFRPLPYTAPDRLVSVGVLIEGGRGPFATEAMLDTAYVQVWDTPPAPFESVTAMDTWTCDIAEERPERVRCGPVDHNFLGLLGIRVALGRDLAPEDDVRGAPRVALISHELWVRRYGGDASALGRTLDLDTAIGSMQQVRIVGVLPADFEMPLEDADILLPAQLRPLDPDRPEGGTFLMALARLRPDVTPARAELMLKAQSPEMAEFGPSSARLEWSVRPLRDRRVGDASRLAWLLAGAVAVFLLIACVNVAHLMLARVAERQREFALRAALGAGELRLARLALAESLLLSMAAGGIGLGAAYALLRTFVTMVPTELPGVADASIDARVSVVTALLMAIAGVGIGLWPAVSVFRAGGLHGLRSTPASAHGVRPRTRFALVTMQIALTLALLGGSALLLRTLWNVVNVPLGFDGERVVTLTAWLSSVSRYPTAADREAFFEELLARAREAPGTVSAALSNAPPPPRPAGRISSVSVEGRSAAPDARLSQVGMRWVSPQFFETFKIPFVDGGPISEVEVSQPAVVVNRSAERMLFAGERAVGRHIQLEALARSMETGPWHTVLGVIGDVRNGERLTDEPGPEVYVIAGRGAWGPIAQLGRLSLRTTDSDVHAAAFLRQIAARIDPRQPVTIQSEDELLTALTARPRFIAWLLTAFAALGLLLAAAGLYSVASYLVAQRRRDIGVRMALGAAPRDVARQVVGEAGRWIVSGALLGCALGWMGTRALQSQLYEVPALDPWAWAAALLVLTVVLAIAVLRPAYRAAHVDPIAALRGE